MKVYKHPEYESNSRRRSYEYKNESVEGTGRRCNCGGSCGNQCTTKSKNRPESDFNFFDNNDAFVSQDSDQLSFIGQESAELIWVKESCNITVSTTDTQAGVSLQAGLQLAIALVLNIAIADSQTRDAVSQQLMQEIDMSQTNKQKIFIYNTKDAVVTTQDTDLAINVNLLLQVLIALVLLVDIF